MQAKTQIQLLAEQARVQSEEDYASERQQTAENTFWQAVEKVIGSDALETLSQHIVGLHCDTNESIEEGLRAATMEETLNSLIAEYDAWNKAQGLNLGSADEHHDDPSLSDQQRAWLRDFSRRWVQATEID